MDIDVDIDVDVDVDVDTDINFQSPPQSLTDGERKQGSS